MTVTTLIRIMAVFLLICISWIINLPYIGLWHLMLWLRKVIYFIAPDVVKRQLELQRPGSFPPNWPK